MLLEVIVHNREVFLLVLEGPMRSGETLAGSMD